MKIRVVLQSPSPIKRSNPLKIAPHCLPDEGNLISHTFIAQKHPAKNAGGKICGREELGGGNSGDTILVHPGRTGGLPKGDEVKYQREEKTAGSSRAYFKKSPFDSPDHLFNRFGQDPEGLQEDRFQGRERARRNHSGHGLKAFARLQHDPCPLVGHSAGI